MHQEYPAARPIHANEQSPYPVPRRGGPGGGFVSTAPSAGHAHLAHKLGEVLVYIGSEDSDASSRQVEAHGGAVVLAKTEIPQTDRFAVFTAPSGNRVGLYTPTHPQPQRHAPDAPSGCA